MTLVKICGITDQEHAMAALVAGADMLGFVFAPSRRQIGPEAAAEIIRRCKDMIRSDNSRWQAVGVFASQPLSLVEKAIAVSGVDVVQLSGDEPPEYCVQLQLPVYKTVHVSGLARGAQLGRMLREAEAHYPVARLLLDAGGSWRWGGTGERFEWESVGSLARDCMVAGGLTPSNVGAAVVAMHPWAVDVSSGVETAGKKDAALIQSFIMEVRRRDSHES